VTETVATGGLFRRPSTARRMARTATAVASSGVLVGMGAATTAPAVAAEAIDCTLGNTVDSSTGTVADIQALLNVDTAIVCLTGTFILAAPLTFNHDLEIFGLPAAQLDGVNLTQILTGTSGASLELKNLSLVRGAGTAGGAVNVDGSLVVENSQFVDNAADEDGGAIFVGGSGGVEVIGSVFSDNATGPEVDGVGGYSGGAIFISDTSTGYFEDSTFSGNTASEAGGAVFSYAALTSQSTFSGNSAPVGGGLYNALGIYEESTFAENSADEGGASRSLFYAATFGSTFVENSAELFGGAIATGFPEGGPEGSGAVISLNSTFVDNTAGEVGGAVLAEYGQIGLSTFLNNEARTDSPDEHSEAIYVVGSDEAMEIGGNIFAGSRANAQLGGSSDSAFGDLGGNVFSTPASTEVALGSPASSDLFSHSVEILFGASAALADNGGPTQTVALVGTSPAINAVPADVFTVLASALEGDLAAAAELAPAAGGLVAASDSPDVDQRNETRAGLADAGAYEYGEPDPELAATGADTVAMGWLAGLTTLLLGAGAALMLGARRRSRSPR